MAPGAPAPGAPAESPGFVLNQPDGSTRAFTNLAVAIASSASGAVLEVPFSGVYETDPIVISGRSLVLRAAEGANPILVNRSVERPLLASDAALVLEGLELRAAHADADLARFPAPGQTARRLVASRFRGIREGLLPPSLIHMRDGVLRITNCRLVASTWQDASGDTVVVQGDSQLELLNSEIYNIGGAGVWCRRKKSTKVADLTVSNCMFYGVQSFFFSGGGAEECRLRVDQCTFFGGHLIALPRPNRLDLSVTDSLICLRGLLHPLMDDAVLSRVKLKEVRNVFLEMDSGTARTSAPLRAGPESVSLELPLQDRLMALAGTARRLGPADFGLREEDFSEVSPGQADIVRNAGAIVDLVGPGEGMRAFRRTDAYQEWTERQRVGQ
jgi:hypothetical protein